MPPGSVESPWSQLTATRMSYRRLFLLCQALLAVLFGLFAVGIWQRAQSRLEGELDGYARRVATAERLALSAQQAQALSLATLIASDPSIGAFLRSAHALELQGSVPDTPAMTDLRVELQRHMANSWDGLRNGYGVAQMQFFTFSGRRSLLRLHAPALYGDSADFRPLVASAFAQIAPAAGFEIGPAFAGVRGVVPVFVGEGAGLNILVGAVEVGVAPERRLEQLDQQLDAGFALLIDERALAARMRLPFRSAFGRPLRNCACRLIASSRSELSAWLDEHGLPGKLDAARPSASIRVGARLFQLVVVPLPAFANQSEASSERVGLVVAWRDVTPLAKAIHDERNGMLALGAFAYVATMLLLALLLRYSRKEWKQQVEIKAGELRREEERLQVLIDAVPDLVLFRDRAGRWLGANASARGHFGLAQLPAEHDGRLAEAPLPGIPELERACDEAWRHGGSLRQDLQLTDRHGAALVLELIVAPSGELDAPDTALVVIGRDVTREREASARIRALSRRHEQVLMSAADGIYGIDPNGLTTFANPAALRSLGFRREELIGRPSHALMHHRHQDGSPYPAAECPARRTLVDGLTRSGEDWFIRKDGSGFPVHLTVAAVRDGERSLGAVVVFQDITEAKRREAELERLASVDPLTGSYNRRVFLERVEAELARMHRHGDCAAVLMLDLDHFKAINDRYGHAAGDALLSAFAGRIMESLRQRIDVLGRLGGEEFAVLLPRTGRQGGADLAERLRAEVEALELPSEQGPIRITVSIGLTTLWPTDARPEDPLGRADKALYAAKEGGRNRVCLAPEPPDQMRLSAR